MDPGTPREGQPQFFLTLLPRSPEGLRREETEVEPDGGRGMDRTGVSNAHLPAQVWCMVLRGSPDPHLAWERIHTLRTDVPRSSPQQRRPRIYSSGVRQVPFSQHAENHSAEVNISFPKPSPRRDAGAVITEDEAGWGGPSSRRAADAGRSTGQGLGWGPPASRPSESGWISSRGDGGVAGGKGQGPGVSSRSPRKRGDQAASMP